MENNKQGCPLRIVEWNIQQKKDILTSNNEPNLYEIIKNKEPDIVVLTECGSSFENIENIIKTINKEEKSSNWEIFFSKENNFNYIAILVNVNNEKIETVERSNFQEDFCENNGRAKIHPDRIAVKITLKNNTDITVLGVRLLTGWGQVAPKNIYEKLLSPYAKRILQNAQFINDIEFIEPDIIIGDFNTDSEMYAPGIYDIEKWEKDILKGTDKQTDRELPPIINSWNKLIEPICEDNRAEVLNIFCKLISPKKGKSYEYWPTKKTKAYSFCSKRTKKDADGQNIAKYTAPDTIIYSNKISLSVPGEDSDKTNPRYYPEIAPNQKLAKDWPSDHCMLITDIEIN